MSVKFLHYRHVLNDGSIDSRGGITFAYVEGEEGLSYATAQCSLDDNYNKKTGRAIASGRLLSEKYSMTFPRDRADFISQLDTRAAFNSMQRV